MSKKSPLRLAISTCPNDTFAFHAILNRKIDFQGLEFEIELLDIEQLNLGLMRGEFDIAKASFHAALLLTDSTLVLPAGSALGFGVGPLLLAASAEGKPEDLQASATVTLCPGEYTTATLLFKMFYARELHENRTKLKQVVFSEIMPALQMKQVDFGVCIHEGRFTWHSQGLHLVEDLGMRWQQVTGQPLPLGGVLGRRSVGHDRLQIAGKVIRNSIEYALQNREETVTTMRRYAQELQDEILFQHVDLYVNQWTIDLGLTGRNALKALHQQAVLARIVKPAGKPLEVVELEI
jgi:1,4-dihydroxy-6-naphthoate synthase